MSYDTLVQTNSHINTTKHELSIYRCQRDKLKRSTNQHVDGIMAPRMPFKRRKLEYEAARLRF